LLLFALALGALAILDPRASGSAGSAILGVDPTHDFFPAFGQVGVAAHVQDGEPPGVAQIIDRRTRRGGRIALLIDDVGKLMELGADRLLPEGLKSWRPSTGCR
jgi:hypothetical protein